MNHHLVALALVISVLPTVAQAQCDEGRVATEQTHGRCCWPEQAFESARCSGPPACPATLVAEGDDCVPRVDEPAQSELLLWPRAPDLSLAIIEPRVVRGIDEGLLIAGITLFAVGYLGGIAIGIVDQRAGNCPPGFGVRSGGTACGSWPTAFVPVAGGIMAGTITFHRPRTSNSIGMIVGPIAAILQLAGVGILLHAAVFQTDDLLSGADDGEARISFAPYATETEGGAALRVDF